MNDIPQVGDRRIESFIRRGDYKNSEESNPEPCVVTEVHRAHRWYRVYFERLGFYGSYKFNDIESDQRID